jgi:hypothetical protein
VRAKTSGSVSAEVKLAADFDMGRDNRYIVASQNFVTKWESLQSESGAIELMASLLAADRSAKCIANVCRGCDHSG